MASQLSLGFANTLYFGDNLEVLRRYVPDRSIDFVYLDPPFNSKRNYNLLFEHRDGSKTAGQIKAFDDTWTWSLESRREYDRVVQAGGKVSKAMRALHEILGTTDMLAYMTMMAPRLVELARVLKTSGSLYLHCDPAASHYLKVLLDAVFGPENFRSEIVWKRTSAHSDAKQGRKGYGAIHDVLLFYSNSRSFYWKPYYTPYETDYFDIEYRHEAKDGGKYKEADATAAKPGGDTSYEWRVMRSPGQRWEADLENDYLNPKTGYEYKGVLPYRNRFWAYSVDNMRTFAREGRLIHRATGMPRLMLMADEMPGVGPQDLWTDISPADAKERVGYPTQKPVALLERMIEASCPAEGVVLDPFCGCGTTVAAAQKLGRRWVGIDITAVAIDVIIERLKRDYTRLDFDLVGEPSTIDEAEALARLDKHEFQAWACRRVGATGVHKKGADRGIDGEIVGVFSNGQAWRGVLSVKGGTLTMSQVRDLVGVVDREKAHFGLVISLKQPTAAMRREAADAGFTKEGIPRLQMLTVNQILEGALPKVPLPSAREETGTNGGRLRAVK